MIGVEGFAVVQSRGNWSGRSPESEKRAENRD